MNSDCKNAPKPDLDIGLAPSQIPCHVAIIMDGNGRWAQKRLLNRIQGHEKGSDAVRRIVRASRQAGIRHLTLYAFSTENWQRPKMEVGALMSLLKRFLKSEEALMLEKGIRLNVVGDKARLPEDVQKSLDRTIAVTSQNRDMVLSLALSYGGREELVRAARTLAQKSKNGLLEPEAISEKDIAACLYTANLPDPDLVIRTSGEIRISNFLLWQVAYAEFYFTPTLWPDFSTEEYFSILRDFAGRQRRFGKTGDQARQVEPPTSAKSALCNSESS